MSSMPWSDKGELSMGLEVKYHHSLSNFRIVRKNGSFQGHQNTKFWMFGIISSPYYVVNNVLSLNSNNILEEQGKNDASKESA
jgi:hypothetical protein